MTPRFRPPILALLAMLWSTAAAGQELPPAEGQTPVPGQKQPPAPTETGSIWSQDTLLGNLFGIRPYLADHGISVGFTLASEVLRNVSGGVELQTDWDNEGVFTLDVDTEKLLGWQSGKLHASALGISGSKLTIDAVQSFTTISSIEAERSFRLFELWYEQGFAHDSISLRVGQLAADQEFLISPNAQLFINADFGWPTLAAFDLPAGGPAYPLAVLGARLRFADGPARFLLGLFNGNATPGTVGDPQQVDGSGTRFSLDGGLFAIAEAQYQTDWRGGGTYKLGAWYNSNGFLDPRKDANGISLASFASTGFPATHRGNWSIYGVADQVLWRFPGNEARGVSGFLRAMGAPVDRNTLSFELDGGLTLKGPFAARPDDSAGFGVSWVHVSSAATALDRDITALGLRRPLRKMETLFEFTYQAEIAPWWQIQPDLQYIRRPGGGTPGDSISHPIPDATIVGVRTTIAF